MKTYLGIDVGSVTTKVVLLDESYQVLDSLYLRTRGKPLEVVQQGLREINLRRPDNTEIVAVGTTGSGRYLAGIVIGADVIKNEITAHAVAASHFVPGVQTIIEIGGQRFQDHHPARWPRNLPMKSYQCIVCGFVYDESLGLPAEGIAPGTRWADIPADWECPDCGVAKADFEMVEI